MTRARLAAFLRRSVYALVDFGSKRPLSVIGIALMIMIGAWSYASKLEVRSDIMELLPLDSPGFQAFERRLVRVGGRATIMVVAESPDRAANERFIDALRGSIDRDPQMASLVSSVESSTKEVRAFFEANKWMYASLADLEDADATLDHQIAIRSGLVADLLGEEKGEKTLGMDKFRDRFKAQGDERNTFPSGYLASADGTQHVMRIYSTTSGLGGRSDEALYARLRHLVGELHPTSFHPALEIGYGGDIANAAAEKESLVHEAMIATLIATLIILSGVVWFYGSPWSLVLVGFPPLFGVGCAYAFAAARYGYVNSSGAFLGAIILGNGVNYPIVLYSRYKEFRARGMIPEVARREAVWNAFRAELVGSSVASIAYGSLMVTRFRGFSQFGMIGFVGMLVIWLSMIPCLPALIVIVERLQARFPAWLRERPATVADDGSRGVVARVVGNFTEKHARLCVGVALVATVLVGWKLPSFLRDPWEYDFDRLGSQGSRSHGSYAWSAKADRILSGKSNLSGSLVLADSPEQVEMVKSRILANDKADPQGSLIEGVSTIDDFLPGPAKLQEQKLATLASIRDRLSPAVLSRMTEEEAQKLREMIPPESLRVVASTDLPDLLKRRFSERDGTVGTVFYIRYRPEISRNDGHNLLRMSNTIDGIRLPDGTRVDTASRATVFAEMIRSLERDGPLATAVSFFAVCLVVLLATASLRGALAVIVSLLVGVVWMLGTATLGGERLNFLNFIALPITFGIGAEYPFNIFDRARLLGGDVTRAVKLHLGAVSLCSFTTTIGYGSLLFADNQALRSFGRLAISGEIACLVAALFLLPAILHIVGVRTSKHEQRDPEVLGIESHHGA